MTSLLGVEFSWLSAPKKGGYEIPEKPQLARNWLKVGDPVEVPQVSDIVVYWREIRDSWQGHVGLFCSWNEDKTNIYTLGGNQENSVNVFPYAVSRKLGYRRVRFDRS